MNQATTERKDFIAYPTNRVVGTLADAAKARACIDALLQVGFHREDVDLLHGEEDLRRLDDTGSDHGFLAQFQRTLFRTFELDEFKHLNHLLEDVRAGRYVLMILAKRRVQRIQAADILNRFGAEFVGFHGRWAWADLSAPPHMTPEEVPALFVRAWNAHDSDAIASLFDEDAEFVSGTGLVLHDRESIRRAHSDPSRTSTLEADAIKVKLLSPEIAVVQTRMTVSGGSRAQSGPRTTIMTFVVHRSGDRWLCASAHNTDVSGA